MNDILNITNGDSAVIIMKQAKLPGEFLPWRDVLHDGPVPGELSLEALSQIRAEFIVSQGWGDADSIKASFIERDSTLKSFENYEKIILWFEHDLYDQLQILQIMDWFQQQHKPLKTELAIICTDHYLGTLSPDQIVGLTKFETPVTTKHLELAANAWVAFRSNTPENWRSLLNTDTSVLPFLEGAVIRQLEEYPSCKNGLSRTANQILKIVSAGEKNCWKIFSESQTLENRVFMGDASFWSIIKALLGSEFPLLELAKEEKWTLLHPKRDTEIEITATGEEVLAGKQNWLEISNIDQWIGGVHLTPNNPWCWDSDSKTITNRI